MKKLTEWDKCVLYLVERGGWVRAVDMKGRESARGFLGSESDRRMQQVMKDQKRDGFYEVEGVRYVIEEGKEGKFKTYRIVSGTPKPKPVMQQMFDENGRPYMKLTYV